MAYYLDRLPSDSSSGDPDAFLYFTLSDMQTLCRERDIAEVMKVMKEKFPDLYEVVGFYFQEA